LAFRSFSFDDDDDDVCDGWSVSDWSLTRAIFIYLTRVEVNGNLFWRPKLHKGDYVFVFGDKDFGRFS
jgi:hypothetical protein